MYKKSPELQSLLDANSFLTFTSSTDLYPQMSGKGLPLLQVRTPLCNAVISLQGAQLLTFETSQDAPLLWLSPNCIFTHGTALRGGVPICFPWFGPHPNDSTKPKHGFARNEYWELSDAKLIDTGECELIFLFNYISMSLFEYSFTAELKMTLGQSAKLQFTVNNTDTNAFSCSLALHSYHPVSSLADVRVKGLAGKYYLDNLENHAQKLQQDDLNFDGEVDRVFLAVDNSLRIEGQPAIEITHQNCPSVIVWNPGPQLAAKIADIGAGNEQNYICVERGAVFDDQWHLAAGESKTAWLEIKEV